MTWSSHSHGSPWFTCCTHTHTRPGPLNGSALAIRACAEPHSPSARASGDGVLLGLGCSLQPCHAHVPGFPVTIREPNHLQCDRISYLLSIIPETIAFPYLSERWGLC